VHDQALPGGGPQRDGLDPHFENGREQVYPGGMREYHLKPFEAAFRAGTSQIMPYYGMPVGTDWEEIGFGFNQGVITGLLRGRYGFDGIVCTDWGLVTDAEIFGTPFPARAWGAEHLSELDRVARILDAGCDQFGGEARPELVIELANQQRISMDRIDQSVRRLLREKFRLGLFDAKRYVDPDRADEIVGSAAFTEAGLDAQRRSIVALTPLPAQLSEKRRPKTLYVQGIDPETAGKYATVTGKPEDADIAVLRIAAPYDAGSAGFAAFFHQGRLDYTAEELAPLHQVAASTQTVVDVFLDRPAILTGVPGTLIADFGASDEAVLDVVFGRVTAVGRLPVELPRDARQVEAGRADVPGDSGDPLFSFGHGMK
jgi:beta-glucosidase